MPEWKMWTARNSDTFVAIMYGPRDAKIPGDLAAAQFTDEYVKKDQSVLTGQKDITLNGWPGLEASVRKPRSLVYLRSYAVSGALLNVLVMSGKTQNC